MKDDKKFELPNMMINQLLNLEDRYQEQRIFEMSYKRSISVTPTKEEREESMRISNQTQKFKIEVEIFKDLLPDMMKAFTKDIIKVIEGLQEFLIDSDC